MRRRAFAGVVAVVALGVLSAKGASVIYVPNEGASPYAWSASSRSSPSGSAAR